MIPRVGLRLHLPARRQCLSVAVGRRGDVGAEGQARRTLRTAPVLGAKNPMKKLLNKSKRKIWYETPMQTPPALRPARRHDQEDSHRCKVLNSLLLKAVRDLLASSQLSHDLQNFNPEISKVALARDFSCCRVFWKSSGDSERDELIQKALDKNSPSIRYLIMSQQIMGGVPPLVFLRDKQHAAIVEVDRLLRQADFGPEPPDDVFDNRLHVAAGDTGSGPDLGSVHPALFGVNHDALNRQIADWRQQSKKDVLSPGPAPELTQEQQSVLEEYRKQQIIKKKKKKAARPVDDDITPREFVLAQGPKTEEPGEGSSFNQEEAQLQELSALEERTL